MEEQAIARLKINVELDCPNCGMTFNVDDDFYNKYKRISIDADYNLELINRGKIVVSCTTYGCNTDIEIVDLVIE